MPIQWPELSSRFPFCFCRNAGILGAMECLRLLIATLALALLAPGCASHASDASVSRSTAALQKVRNSNLQDFVREFGADWGSVTSFYELPWSEVRFNRLESLFKGWQERL